MPDKLDDALRYLSIASAENPEDIVVQNNMAVLQLYNGNLQLVRASS
jgi:hypothetical protein